MNGFCHGPELRTRSYGRPEGHVSSTAPETSCVSVWGHCGYNCGSQFEDLLSFLSLSTDNEGDVVDRHYLNDGNPSYPRPLHRHPSSRLTGVHDQLSCLVASMGPAVFHTRSSGLQFFLRSKLFFAWRGTLHLDVLQCHETYGGSRRRPSQQPSR